MGVQPHSDTEKDPGPADLAQAGPEGSPCLAARVVRRNLTNEVLHVLEEARLFPVDRCRARSEASCWACPLERCERRYLS